jgi:hypothetical protein
MLLVPFAHCTIQYLLESKKRAKTLEQKAKCLKSWRFRED